MGLLAVSLIGEAAGAAVLRIEQAWVRQVPGSDVAAVYLTLRNTGDKPVSVVGIESPLAGSAMIHQTKIEGGMSRMRPQSALLVPPGQTLKLAPGGIHIMLMDVRPLATGENVPLVLKLADGTSVRADAQVRPLTAQ
jgi:copper(I)-binding protein